MVKLYWFNVTLFIKSVYEFYPKGVVEFWKENMKY